jgi:hypothetical protein
MGIREKLTLFSRTKKGDKTEPMTGIGSGFKVQATGGDSSDPRLWNRDGSRKTLREIEAALKAKPVAAKAQTAGKVAVSAAVANAVHMQAVIDRAVASALAVPAMAGAMGAKAAPRKLTRFEQTIADVKAQHAAQPKQGDPSKRQRFPLFKTSDPAKRVKRGQPANKALDLAARAKGLI